VRIHDYLTARTHSAWRQLRESLEGLGEPQATAGVHPDWPGSRFGVGLNGSIAGIVRHLTAWKQAAAGAAEGYFPHADPARLEALEWTQLLMELNTAHAAVEQALEACPDTALETQVMWEGHSMPLWKVFSHLLEHDHYHAGQINLIRQHQALAQAAGLSSSGPV
jgi:uncharacterized damage-inducible protein DinB